MTLLAQPLQRESLINYSRGQITIVDREELEREACECFHVLRHDKLPRTIGVKLRVGAYLRRNARRSTEPARVNDCRRSGRGQCRPDRSCLSISAATSFQTR